MDTNEIEWRISHLEEQVRDLERQNQKLEESISPRTQYTAVLSRDKPLWWVPIE
jgi:hypothetical protein